MEPTSREVAPTRLLGTAVRRHLVLVIATTVLCALVAAGAASLMHTTFTATSAVLIKPAPGNPLSPSVVTSNGTQLTVAMSTEVGLVTTPGVSSLANKALHRSSQPTNESVTATVPPNTQIIQVAYTAPSAAKARDGAQAFAQAVLGYRASMAKQTQDHALSGLQRQLSTATNNLKTASGQAANQTDPRSYAQQQVQLYAQRVASLNDAISAAEAVSQNPGSIVTPGVLPDAADGVSRLVILLGGLLTGLLFGVALAVLREWRDDRVHGDTDTMVAGLPVLTTIPAEAHRGARLISERPAHDPVNESYRRLRAAVVATGHRPHSIAVSAVTPGSSAALVGANLGLTLAESGYPVRLVNADPSSSLLEETLRVPRSPGLSDLAAGHVDYSALLRRVEGVDVLPSGDDSNAARELFSGPRFPQLVERLAQPVSAYVLVSAAGAWTADADAASSAAGAAMLIALDKKTTHASVANARARLERLGVAVAGVVIAGQPSRRSRRGIGKGPEADNRLDLFGAEGSADAQAPATDSDPADLSRVPGA